MYKNEPNWDEINLKKEQNIKWLNALNNAVALVAAYMKNTEKKLSVDDVELNVRAYANFIYELEPKNKPASKPIPTKPATIKPFYRPDTMKVKPISPKQIEFIKKLAKDRDVEVPDIEMLDSWQASQKITELKKFPVKKSVMEGHFEADLDAGEAIEYE